MSTAVAHPTYDPRVSLGLIVVIDLTLWIIIAACVLAVT